MKSDIRHVAIIMDGNGRWAQAKSWPRVWGHVRGSNNVSKIVKVASDLNLSSLTLYAFSTENWSRPTTEVTNLFKILKKFLHREKATILKEDIKFDVIGNYKVLESDIVNAIEELKEQTEHKKGLNLNIAVNYGGRSEILDAVNKFIKMNPGRELREGDLAQNLYNPNVRDIDLLIRTAGDQRISNFLLWQLSYAEVYFTNTKWPEFSGHEFREIIKRVSNRDRRFGGLNSPIDELGSNVIKN